MTRHSTSPPPPPWLGIQLHRMVPTGAFNATFNKKSLTKCVEPKDAGATSAGSFGPKYVKTEAACSTSINAKVSSLSDRGLSSSSVAVVAAPGWLTCKSSRGRGKRCGSASPTDAVGAVGVWGSGRGSSTKSTWIAPEAKGGNWFSGFVDRCGGLRYGCSTENPHKIPSFDIAQTSGNDTKDATRMPSVQGFFLAPFFKDHAPRNRHARSRF